MFLIYVNDMTQGVKLNIFLYIDGSCSMYQHKDVKHRKKTKQGFGKYLPLVRLK